MLKHEAAAYLAGLTSEDSSNTADPTNVHVISGEVSGESEDGKVLISIDGMMFSEDDNQYVEVDALGGLEDGDVATILLTGESGHGMTPLAIGGVGSVDRLKARVVDAELLLADKASIDDLEAATARIGDLEADHVSVDTLEAATARIENLEVDHVSVADFEVEQANIDSLQAATADIDTIRANSAKVQNLTAAQLEADHATVGSLSTTYATIANLNAANGRITTLESTKANISDLEADYITADEIEATYMHANMSNSDVAWISNGTIKDGAIVSAMINDVSANKLTAGTINGSVINVTNLNADNITAGTINGQRIGQGSLSLDKLSESVYTEAEVDTIVDGLNDRIDGAIETHTGTTVPTLNNAPASSWNTTALRDEHVGDVYYVVNSQSQQNGYCYRFTKSGSTYSWQLIKDSDVTAALSRLTTAEGKITSIESFDSTVSSFMTNTDDELTSIKSRATSLETRMTDAEGDISDKVDTSTFNTLSQTVDTNTASITSLSSTVSQKADGSTVTALTNRVSTVEQDVDGIETSIGELQTTVSEKADSSTVTTVSNRLNTVSDTVDGHTQTLTSVQNTLSTKADSSTVSTLTTQVNTIEDTVDGHTQTISGQSTILSNNGLTSSTNITNRVSSVEQDLSGYKTTVSETYATQTALATTNGNVTAAQTAADNAQAAADRANGRQVAFSATSSTGASTAAKVAACTNFPTLAAGATVTVRFSAANTSTGAVTLNVNSTGAKTVYVNGAATSSSNQLLWGANANITFTYDGSYWRVDSEPRTWYGTGAVAAATAAKTATINEVVICKGTTVVLNMTYENTNTSATLNVTSTGAKNIYYGTTTTRPTTANGYGWGAGSTVSLTFDGQYWRIGDTTALARLTAAESTISSHTTSISQNAQAIALKADSSTTYTKTDVDGLISTEVTNRNAAITAKASEITSSVSETYATKSSVNDKADASDVTALAGRVTTAESNITQNANNIALKVSESDVTGNYIVGKINLNSTTASIAAEHINLQGAVTISDLASDAQNATLNSNISVGGRNLLGNTENRSGSAITTNNLATNTFGSIGNYNDAVSLYSLVNYDGSSNAVSATSKGTGNRGAGWFTKAGAIRAGESYTFSCRVKCSIATDIHAHTAWRNGSATAGYTGWSRVGSTKAIVANTWTDYSCTFVPSSNAQLDWEFFVAMCITGSSSGATYQIAHAKLEKGNKATDWTPAPEDVDAAISNAAKTATSYVTDITGGGIMIHPSTDQTTGVWITSDVDIMRSGTSVINIGTNDAVRIGATGNAQMHLESGGLEVDNEAGTPIFEVETAGGEPRTREKDLHTWDTTASVTMTPYEERDSEVADGDVTVTVEVNGTYYTLGSSYVNVAITAGVSVSVNLTQSGVPYVKELMVELDDDGNVIATYPCTLFVEYTLATTVRAKLSFTGDQLVDGVGGAIVAENTVWSSDDKTDVFLVARNVETGAGVRLGVGAGGYNRGVYDHAKNDWVIYRNADNKTVINGPNFSVAASGATKCGLAGNFTRTSVTVLSSQSLAVEGYESGTTTLTKAGWKPIGIAGWHSNSRFAITMRAYVSGASNGSGTLNWEVYNARTSSITATVVIYVLWARV